jgi:putative tricarboxylic transport membrane protein
MLESLSQGLFAVLEWQNLIAMAAGVFGGVTAGAIPGLSATMAVALMLPLTYGLNPLFALGLMAGLHNGAAYGGSIPAILLRIPGTPAAVATTFDGYPMAQSGRVAHALKVSVVSSAIGGVVSAIALMTLAPPLADMALKFGPPEIFWVSVFGIVSTAVLIGKDPIKGLMAGCLGLLLGLVGLDHVTGVDRFTFGVIELSGGLPLPIVLMALFGVPAAWMMAEKRPDEAFDVSGLDYRKENDRLRDWPWRAILPAWVRGGVIGTFVGILPGLGGAVSSVVAYGSQKRAAKDGDSYGGGNTAGVAVAECANNADNAASMIPALTLGIPGSGVAAIVLAGLLIHGMEPGPQLFSDRPDVVFGYMWAMMLTAMMLVLVGGGLATRLFAQVLRVPSMLMMPIIVALAVIGTYTYENSIFNVYLLFALGFVGYALDRLSFPVAPVILGLFLGPKVEYNLRVSLLISQDDWSVLWTRPISLAILIATVLIIFLPLIRRGVRDAVARGRAGAAGGPASDQSGHETRENP